MARICIVTNAPVSQNPRVVKEADTLSSAGHDVVVLCVQYEDWTVPLDDEIVSHSAWRTHVVFARGGTLFNRVRGFVRTIRSKCMGYLAQWIKRSPVPELAYSRFYSIQLKQACEVGADLYIGHNPQSLPIVAAAAKLTGARYAFDAEDFHTGQYAFEEASLPMNVLLEQMERRYLHEASYLTAASFGIAQALEEKYNVKASTVLNVFSLNERVQASTMGLKTDRPSNQNRISLYWYSQIIGLDRGLQTVIRAMAAFDDAFELHLRGHADDRTQTTLKKLADEMGVAHAVFLHQPVAPAQLTAKAMEHDVGLCVESPVILNRDLCITNKIFHFSLAGLCIVASDTRGQRDVFDITPGIGLLYTADCHQSLSKALEQLLADTRLLERCKQESERAASERWNWELESKKLVALVDESLEGDTPLHA